METAIPVDRPNVPIPAPIFMGAFLGLGYGLNRIWPMALQPGTLQFMAGWAYILAATILLLWCFSLFIRSHTTILPKRPVSQFVMSGPYRYSRNPMYLSLALYYLGIAIATGNLWHVISFMPFLVVVRIWVIAPEEHYLQSRFGSAYDDFCARVPRWF